MGGSITPKTQPKKQQHLITTRRKGGINGIEYEALTEIRTISKQQRKHVLQCSSTLFTA